MNSHQPSSCGTRTQRRKSTLFCPDCGHESPPTGDWRSRRVADAVVFVCPECRADVTQRPVDTGESQTTVLSTTTDLFAAVWRSTVQPLTAWMLTLRRP